MSSKSATLAKSLHTVSVIVAIARLYPPSIGAAPAVARALRVLGYENAADPYGLADRAIMLLAKESAPEQRAARPMSGAALLDSGRDY
jgi:hypothetical protein